MSACHHITTEQRKRLRSAKMKDLPIGGRFVFPGQTLICVKTNSGYFASDNPQQGLQANRSTYVMEICGETVDAA